MTRDKIITSKKFRTTFDLFAGCGGLSTGLEMAGFNPLLVCELDDNARESFVINRFSKIGTEKFSELHELHFGDVYSLAGKQLNKTVSLLNELSRKGSSGVEGIDLDLICGGPPCQGDSGIGHRRSYGVEKIDIPSNKLFEPMAQIIEKIKPKIFLFENVRGILSGRWTKDGQKGEIWNSVLARFNKIPGYVVKWNLVQAKNYGVPQNRPRVLLIGIRLDVAQRAKVDYLNKSEDAIVCGFLPKPISGESPNIIDLLSDLVDPITIDCLKKQTFPNEFKTSHYLFSATNEIQRWLRTYPDGTLIKKGDLLHEQEYSKHNPKVVEKFSYMLRNNGEIPLNLKTKKFAQRLLPEKWDSSGPSITATSLPDDYVHFCQPRTLTVREWARLQTFPDWYRFSGKRTTGGIRRAGNPLEGLFTREVPKYTQIGNAVPVKFAEKIGIHLNLILSKAD